MCDAIKPWHQAERRNGVNLVSHLILPQSLSIITGGYNCLPLWALASQAPWSRLGRGWQMGRARSWLALRFRHCGSRNDVALTLHSLQCSTAYIRKRHSYCLSRRRTAFYKSSSGDAAGFMIDLCRAVVARLPASQTPQLNVRHVLITAADVCGDQQGRADLLCELTNTCTSRACRFLGCDSSMRRSYDRRGRTAKYASTVRTENRCAGRRRPSSIADRSVRGGHQP